MTDQYNEHWRTDWIASDFWYLLNFIFLCVVCWLFRPSQQAARYSDLDGVPHCPMLNGCCCSMTSALQPVEHSMRSVLKQSGRSKTDKESTSASARLYTCSPALELADPAALVACQTLLVSPWWSLQVRRNTSKWRRGSPGARQPLRTVKSLASWTEPSWLLSAVPQPAICSVGLSGLPLHRTGRCFLGH